MFPETLDYVRSTPGLDLWAYSPLINGAYGRADRPLEEAYDHPGTTRRLEALTRVADRLGVRRSQVVLAWLLHLDPPIRPIVGVSSVEQLEPALAAGALDLDEATLARVVSACRGTGVKLSVMPPMRAMLGTAVAELAA